MGSYRWVQVAVLTALMIGAGAVQAATRVPVKPLSHDVAVSNKSVVTKGTDTVKFTVHEGEYIPGVNGRKTPVPVSKSLIQSIPRTIEHTRKLVSLPDILLTGTIAGLIAGLDWVMDEGGEIKKREDTYQNLPVAGEGTFNPQSICALYPASQTMNKITVTNQGGIIYAVGVWPSTDVPGGGRPADFNQAVNNCTQRHLGYTYNQYGYWPQSGAKVISLADIETTLTPLTTLDLDRIAPYVNGQTGEWIRDLMRESCAQSPSPGACLESLQEGGPQLSGPASVQGPKEVTTGTYTRPDGTTGTTKTETSTTYNIKYGPTYIDITNNKTVTTYKDDQKVGEETSTDGEEVTEEVPQEENEQDYSFQDATFPEVEPFYEQQYPDGLNGVWNQRKQDFDNSAFLAFLRSFIPSFSGSCPAWAMSFDLRAFGNFSSHGFNVGCYVFDFIGVVILVTALFTARMVTFGG
ncbi:hypothetical protein [Pseudomonas sp. OTU5201]|uniref:hypothetical protein n=1 Tax=Pseudomonas sp. OTU5201 TaxID=3043850 RepID=UPI00313B1D23